MVDDASNIKRLILLKKKVNQCHFKMNLFQIEYK
jgi:hypothetical protein